VEPLEIPLDDSWMRDSGPIFVTDDRGSVALVQFGFNSWGEKYLPYDKDAAVPEAIAAHLGMRRYRAPFVLEGGSFFVDGEGTLLTTEQCLLNANRNPTMSRHEIETGLGEYLGVDKVVWLQAFEDRDTDGHVDGIAQYVRPGALVLQTPRDPANGNFEFAEANLERMAGLTDAGANAGGPALRAHRARGSGRSDRRDPVPELLSPERRGGDADRRPARRRGGDGANRRDLPGPRGRSGPGRRSVLRGRRAALHHPAGPGGNAPAAAGVSALQRGAFS
jgi:hypothetical protein